MKICILTRRFDLRSGGIGRVSTEIRDRLQQRGHDVVSVSTDKEDLVNYFKYTFWSIQSKIPKDCDIYHAITPMESLWIPKGRSVATILDIIPITHPEKHGARMGGSKIKYTIGKLCFAIGCRHAAKCEGVACISKHVQDEYSKYFGRRARVIRLGIRDDLEPLAKEDKTFRIGYLGQVDRRKRVDVLVDAFKQSKLDAELWIAGEGSDKSRLQEISAHDSRIHFAGFIPDDMISRFYNQIDVLVFPTSIEGYGLPPVESMACKKPVIVLRDAIIPDDVKSRCIITDNLYGILSDQDMLKDIISTVDLDSNYKFAKSHNWDECVDKYLHLYKEILG